MRSPRSRIDDARPSEYIFFFFFFFWDLLLLFLPEETSVSCIADDFLH